ncbi:GtrA family protein [Pseudonocardia alaniniphila]|uniref:GtrA family protein n=1 Tax=Pseudonocardia alaniniphila TaxID=75291 RepID=A0ABS9T857_9PSEU|nr:GtrA family protein [Pseudonocardia alaniniphila]MCH6164702.1 GtrA family protein [Pseudonocardia alaniniphila]
MTNSVVIDAPAITGTTRFAQLWGDVVEVAGAALPVGAPLGGMPSGRGPSGHEQRHPLLVQLARYAVIGGLGTLVNAVIFLLLRTWWDTIPANLVALVLSTVVSTEANRRFTFEGARVHWLRSHVQSGGTVLFYVFYSSAVLMLLAATIDSPTAWEQTVAVAVASVLGGLGRFLVLRYWVFEPEARDDSRSEGSAASHRAERGSEQLG